MFIFSVDNQVILHSSLKVPEDRTRALGDVVKSLGEKLIPGIRNEVLLPLSKCFPIAFCFLDTRLYIFKANLL